jgi:hypothetical protein
MNFGQPYGRSPYALNQAPGLGVMPGQQMPVPPQGPPPIMPQGMGQGGMPGAPVGPGASMGMPPAAPQAMPAAGVPGPAGAFPRPPTGMPSSPQAGGLARALQAAPVRSSQGGY